MSSVVDRELSEYFGFTREEVSKLFDHIGVRADIETISQWYGGYGFEDLELFNPWSILWFANRRTFEPYWVNTGSNETVASMIQKIPGSLEVLSRFIEDEFQWFYFRNQISYKDMPVNADALLSYLVQCGYLVLRGSQERDRSKLAIPNQEVRDAFRYEIITRNMSRESLGLAAKFKTALLEGKTEQMAVILQNYIRAAFSYYDMTTEKEYQVLVTGLIAILLEEYAVRSEVNGPRGRCDILISPKKPNQAGIVIEIKKYKGKIGPARLKTYAKSAIAQIREMGYFDTLLQLDCPRILLYGVVFDDDGTQIASDEFRPAD